MLNSVTILWISLQGCHKIEFVVYHFTIILKLMSIEEFWWNVLRPVSFDISLLELINAHSVILKHNTSGLSSLFVSYSVYTVKGNKGLQVWAINLLSKFTDQVQLYRIHIDIKEFTQVKQLSRFKMKITNNHILISRFQRTITILVSILSGSTIWLDHRH